MNRAILRRKFDGVVQEVNPDLGKKFLVSGNQPLNRKRDAERYPV
ncbi:hypothetical protein DOT_5054 [Desulfosporosinus sp. OT]|nr:hypothetical protein DOT_5054 [Desulfosporosinus sp. OT]